MKTYVATPSTRERNWLVVDASGKTLGRLATQIAEVLRGKRKPEYTPHIDVGDFVIVVNAERVAVTGKKRQEKRYYRHSGYHGGLRSRTLEEMLARRPEEVLRLAVKGMLPRSRLGRALVRGCGLARLAGGALLLGGVGVAFLVEHQAWTSRGSGFCAACG